LAVQPSFNSLGHMHYNGLKLHHHGVFFLHGIPDLFSQGWGFHN